MNPHPADERLAILRIERPPVNAFDQAMWDLFDTVAASLHGSTMYRAVVVTGGDRHFAAGADVKALLGLVDRVLEDTDVLDAGIGEGLSYARGPLALRYAKQAVNASVALPVEAGLALEADLIAQSFATEDGQHGLRSFVDNGPRKATFHGR